MIIASGAYDSSLQRFNNQAPYCDFQFCKFQLRIPAASTTCVALHSSFTYGLPNFVRSMALRISHLNQSDPYPTLVSDLSFKL